MEKTIKVGDKIYFLAGRSVDFNMYEFNTILYMFKVSLEDAMKKVPMSGRIKMVVKFTRSK